MMFSPIMVDGYEISQGTQSVNVVYDYSVNFLKGMKTEIDNLLNDVEQSNIFSVQYAYANPPSSPVLTQGTFDQSSINLSWTRSAGNHDFDIYHCIFGLVGNDCTPTLLLSGYGDTTYTHTNTYSGSTHKFYVIESHGQDTATSNTLTIQVIPHWSQTEIGHYDPTWRTMHYVPVAVTVFYNAPTDLRGNAHNTLTNAIQPDLDLYSANYTGWEEIHQLYQVEDDPVHDPIGDGTTRNQIIEFELATSGNHIDMNLTEEQFISDHDIFIDKIVSTGLTLLNGTTATDIVVEFDYIGSQGIMTIEDWFNQ